MTSRLMQYIPARSRSARSQPTQRLSAWPTQRQAGGWRTSHQRSRSPGPKSPSLACGTRRTGWGRGQAGRVGAWDPQRSDGVRRNGVAV